MWNFYEDSVSNFDIMRHLNIETSVEIATKINSYNDTSFG